MSAVSVLPSDLINQIAAGEVVERPASVVKELVENAIDAGAPVIEILLENGGRKLIEVRDNGCGMSRRRTQLARVERHATSKIAGFDDLLTVRTLGFRGEALPSIASVSRFTLPTFDGRSPTGQRSNAIPTGEHSRPAARDRGTTIRVRELFENVPARRKFLKSADAEFRSIVTSRLVVRAAASVASIPRRAQRTHRRRSPAGGRHARAGSCRSSATRPSRRSIAIPCASRIRKPQASSRAGSASAAAAISTSSSTGGW